MNKIVVGFNLILAAAVVWLFFKSPSGNTKTEENKIPKTEIVATGNKFTTEKGKGEVRVAFINSDSLSVRYELFKKAESDLTVLNEKIGKELQQKEQSLMATGQRLQKDFDIKSKSEQEAAMRQMQALEMNYNKFKEEKMAELDKVRNENLQKADEALKKFLEKYCADNKIDFVLKDGMVGSIFYANKIFDITDDVANGLNNEYNKSK